MCGELSGWGKIMLLSNYNDWFRAHRKWIAQDIGSYASVAKLHRMIEFEARRYLQCVLEDSERNQAHIRKYFTSIILRLSHGYVTQAGDDPLVDLAHVANSQLSMATAPGLYYVDFVPPMKYIPSWLPGAGFRRKAKKYAVVLRDLVEIPHNYVKSQLANSVSYAFYLAMTLSPRVVRKAQQELDSVVGTGRLPTFADRQSLPYMEALFTELLRWYTPAPTSWFLRTQPRLALIRFFVAIRCTRVDDEYNGYLIPAGSYVFVNIWGILRDERTYSDPLEFKPERFLGDKPEPHPGNACFGFGRRKCPGYFLGHSSVWLMCAQSLAVFDITKCVENGVEITPEHNIVGETIVHLAPFQCSIKPRSAEAECLIRQEFPYTADGRTE
ncbi:cytochrome P450 [Boletus reticuloceps]|uniref:Cytochrome P450 n=1 Tax=Boletus reticuloceps TaxID=495285 RepID=A0A8I2YMB4_9AGAM|nr:cytochrome P450 [Boletus reticuloceps]